MGEEFKTCPLRCSPGIKRDGTMTQGTAWNDGLWTRFYQTLPRSILGYRSMTNQYPGPSRGLLVNLNGTGYLDIFSGSSDALNVGQFTTGGSGSGVVDITPAGFTANPNNVWQMDSLYNSNGGGYTAIFAHAAPNLANIASDVATPIYYGDITAAIPLVAAMDDSPAVFTISGGIMALGPFLVAYGSKGLVAVTDAGAPAVFPLARQFNPTATKIVKGLALRGNSAPSGLLWSIDSILQMVFVGGDQIFSFSTITDQSSVLSSSGFVEFDGVYYWPGIDRWLTFNGVLRELPNEMNLDFFYTNLNIAQRQKVFGFKIPRWGEIWWCAPMFGATECNWAFIYNVRENTWYDTPLPADGRSAAYFAQSWTYPVIFGANPLPADSAYQLYQHEFGYDSIRGNAVDAIPSYVLSADIDILNSLGGDAPSGVSMWTQLVGFEPDFLFGTQMSVEIFTRPFAQSSSVSAGINLINQGDVYFDTQVQGRYIQYKIASNIQGGYFVMGNNIIRYREGDMNP